MKIAPKSKISYLAKTKRERFALGSLEHSAEWRHLYAVVGVFWCLVWLLSPHPRPVFISAFFVVGLIGTAQSYIAAWCLKMIRRQYDEGDSKSLKTTSDTGG